MSRFPRQIGSDCPPVVTLIKYGILGGMAAAPVSISFRDFPADLLCRLWGAVVKHLPREQLVEVWSHADIRRLKNDPHSARVVLMYAGQHRILSPNVVDWLVELRRSGSYPLPAILSVYQPSSTDTPGATLVAQGDDDLCHSLGQWLQQHDASVRIPNVLDTAFSVDTSSLIGAIRQAAAGRPLSVRDINILNGLVIGATINQAFHNGTPSRPIQAPGPDHYAEVHGLLNARPFHLVEQQQDELTLYMVARANLYLRAKADNQAVKPTRLGGRSGSTSTIRDRKSAANERPHHITRRELVDLGNPNSSITKSLLQQLLQSNDSEVLQRIGVTTTGRLGHFPQTRPPNASELTKSMTTWTYKMVRSRFDRLESEGLIEVRKTADNAALEYVVPEELVDGRSLFVHLPDPHEVQAIYEANCLPDMTPVCP